MEMFSSFFTTTKPNLNFSAGVYTMVVNLGRSIEYFPYEAVDVVCAVCKEKKILFSALNDLQKTIEHDAISDENKPKEKQPYAAYIKHKFKHYDTTKWTPPQNETKLTDRKNRLLGGKTYTQIRQDLDICHDKTFSFALKISGYVFVLWGISTLGSSLAMILTVYGAVMTVVGIATIVFGHDLAVIGTNLRERVEPSENNKSLLRGWVIVETALDLVPIYKYPVDNLKKEVKPMLEKTYLVPIILANIYGIKEVLGR